MGAYNKYYKSLYRKNCKDKTCVAFANGNSSICKECVEYNDKYNACKSCGVKGTHKLGEFCADTFLCRHNRGVDVNDNPVDKSNYCKGCHRDFANYPSNVIVVDANLTIWVCYSCGYKNEVSKLPKKGAIMLECRTIGCNNTLQKRGDSYCERCLRFGVDKRMQRQKQMALDHELMKEKKQRSGQYNFELNPPKPYSWMDA